MKRIPALRDLSDDHHTGLVLARRCKRAGRGDGDAPSAGQVWDEVRAFFASHLEPHFRIEEVHLLPGLEVIGEPDLASRIEADHRALRALSSPPAADPERVARFGELLEAHIRFEEREVFEPTQQRLPADTLRAIASASEAVPRSCPDWLEGTRGARGRADSE